MRPTADTVVSFNPRMQREIGTLIHDGTMVPYSALTTAVQSTVTTIVSWWVDLPISAKVIPQLRVHRILKVENSTKRHRGSTASTSHMI